MAVSHRSTNEEPILNVTCPRIWTDAAVHEFQLVSTGTRYSQMVALFNEDDCLGSIKAGKFLTSRTVINCL
jgi:hypothetical protein